MANSRQALWHLENEESNSPEANLELLSSRQLALLISDAQMLSRQSEPVTKDMENKADWGIRTMPLIDFNGITRCMCNIYME